MIAGLDFLREMNIWSVLFRLVLAVLFGGLVGLERMRKHRAAGFRTYILVSLGATLTMLLGQYEHHMLDHLWAGGTAEIGPPMDVSRFGAQVINGVGFLGAGTIMVTGRQRVKGMTTAAGLWASACLGLVIGAGFYECVFLAFLMIFLSAWFLPVIETAVIEKSRNMNIYVAFNSLDDVGAVISRIKDQGLHIYEVDIDHGHESGAQHPSAVFAVRMEHRQIHTRVLSAISGLECVRAIKEF